MKSSAKHIGEILKSIVKEHGWEHDIDSAKIPSIWYKLLGDKGTEITTYIRFDEGKVYIHVQSAPWRSELTLRKHELIEKMNDEIGYSLIKDIIFR